MRDDEFYAGQRRQVSSRSRNVLMSIQCPHKMCSTLKSAVFGLSSSLLPVTDVGGYLSSFGKTDLVSDHFDHKQSRDSVDLASYQFYNICRLGEVRLYFLDLDSYIRTDPLCKFSLF